MNERYTRLRAAVDDAVKRGNIGGDYRTYDVGSLLCDHDALAARLAKAERDADQLIGERDHAEEMADKLADALATLLGVEIGEHSSGNCPWTEALEAFEERATDSAPADCKDAPRLSVTTGSAPAANPHCLNDGTPCAPDGSGGCTACSRTFSADACTCPGTLTPEVHYTGCPAAQEE